MDKRLTYFIPSFLLIGLGIGLIFNKPGPGMLIGLGVGFLMTTIFSIVWKNGIPTNNEKKE